MPLIQHYQPRERIGPYQIISLLGMGGTCAIYEAARLLEDRPREKWQVFALKVPTYAAANVSKEKLRADTARIEREFRTLQKLEHRSIVRVFELGQHRGVPYYSMEWMKGRTLPELIAEERPSLFEVMGWFVQVCEAIKLLHESGIAHRDIKPQNVYVRSDTRVAVLLDFGLCRPLSGSRLSGPGELLGTIPYLSQEYCHYLMTPRRKAKEPSAPYDFTRTDDVFSLGVMMYELLTGRLPWKTPPERQADLLQEIRDTSSLRHPSGLYRRLPTALGDFAVKMLERAVARPRNGAEVLTGLYPLLEELGEELKTLPAALPRSAGATSSLRENLGSSLTRRVLSAFPWKRGGRAIPLRPGAWTMFSQLWRPIGLASGMIVLYLLAFLLGQGSSKHEALLLAGERAAGLRALSDPVPGQMRPPCPKPYVEDSGGCWDEFPAITSAGKPQRCPTNPLVREVRGADGRLRCRIPVMVPSPYTKVPGGR